MNTTYYQSIFTSIVVSVLLDNGRGCASFAIANNWFESLYNPTVVTYGLKDGAVANSFNVGSG